MQALALSLRQFGRGVDARYAMLRFLWRDPQWIALVVAAIFAAGFLQTMVGWGAGFARDSREVGRDFGGDFVIFYTAGRLDAGADAAAIYDYAQFEAELDRSIDGRKQITLPFLYPPPMLFLTEPFAGRSYVGGYIFQSMAFLTLLSGVLFAIWRNPAAVFIAMTSQATLLTVVGGQNGMVVAALIAVAAFYAATRPALAGAAAGLMIIKPHFALLAPFAFLAGRNWRAIAAAALAASAACALATLVYGVDAWTAFAHGMANNPAPITADDFPYAKFFTAFAAARELGAPVFAAAALQLAMTAMLGGFVMFAFARLKSPELRLAAFAAAAPLATPYAHNFDLVIFVPALFALAAHAHRTGWMAGERPLLAFLWAMPIVSPPFSAYGSVTFACALMALSLVVRRVFAASLTSASAGAPVRAGL